MAIFGPKPWVSPFGKVSIVHLFELFVFIAQKGVFLVLKYDKIHFPGQYSLKKKFRKTAIFGPKPQVNPFGKISIFRLFQLLVFIGWKGIFLFQNIIKDIFLAYITLKKNLEKWPFLDRNHGLTPLEKCQFFDFLNLCFLFFCLERRFFVVDYHKSHFCGLCCVKKKSQKNGNFWTKTMEKCQFFDLLNFLFLQPRKAFIRSRIL